VPQLDARPELAGALAAAAYVRVAAERPLFHVAVVDPQVDESEPQRLQVLARLFGAAQLRLADDLDQRNAAAVQVHVRAVRPVDVLPSVLFEVDAREPHLAHAPVGLRNGDRAALADGELVLRDLEALRKIGIEIVLPRPHAALRDLTPERLPRLDGHPDDAPVPRRPRAGNTEAHRAHLRMRRRAQVGRAGTDDP